MNFILCFIQTQFVWGRHNKSAGKILMFILIIVSENWSLSLIFKWIKRNPFTSDKNHNRTDEYMCAGCVTFFVRRQIRDQITRVRVRWRTSSERDRGQQGVWMSSLLKTFKKTSKTSSSFEVSQTSLLISVVNFQRISIFCVDFYKSLWSALEGDVKVPKKCPSFHQLVQRSTLLQIDDSTWIQ